MKKPITGVCMFLLGSVVFHQNVEYNFAVPESLRGEGVRSTREFEKGGGLWYQRV
jgi:hypothetical protein